MNFDCGRSSDTTIQAFTISSVGLSNPHPETAAKAAAFRPRAPNSLRRWANWRRKADSNSRSHEGSARRAWAERDTVGQRQEYPVPSGPSDLRPFSAAKNYVHRGNGTRAARPQPPRRATSEGRSCADSGHSPDERNRRSRRCRYAQLWAYDFAVDGSAMTRETLAEGGVGA